MPQKFIFITVYLILTVVVWFSSNSTIVEISGQIFDFIMPEIENEGLHPEIDPHQKICTL